MVNDLIFVYHWNRDVDYLRLTILIIMWVLRNQSRLHSNESTPQIRSINQYIYRVKEERIGLEYLKREQNSATEEKF